MNSFTGRLLGYLFLSLFLAFAAGPYTTQKRVSKTGPVVFLSALALSAFAQKPLCPGGVASVSDADLKAFPKILKAVSSLSRWPIEANRVSLFGGNLGKFIRRCQGENQRSMCFEHNGRYFNLTWLLIRDIGSLYLIGFKEPPDVPSLDPSGLAGYSRLADYVDTLKGASDEGENRRAMDDRLHDFRGAPSWAVSAARGSRPFYETVRTDIGAEEWTRLSQALGVSPEGAVFRFGDYLILGASQVMTERVLVPIGWFRIARYAFAALFLILGLLAMRGIYKRRPGITLNPRWSAFIGDGLFILFSGFGAYCLIEYGMSRFFNMTSFLNEDVVRGMCAVGYVSVTAFFALFSAHQFSQSVEVSQDGVRLHYPGSVNMLKWEDIEGFDLKDSYTVVGRGGMMMPRKLQTKLVIRTKEGDMTLVEPGYGKTKQELISRFRAHAPDRLRPDLEKLSEVW